MMLLKRIVPNSNLYETVTSLNKGCDVLLFTSSGVSLVISFLGIYGKFPELKDFLIFVNIVFICLYAFLDNRANYIFTRAEMKRRLDWLDNSFGTNFSGKKSEGYFTNDQLPAGLYKLAVNCFENSFHSSFILSKMLLQIIVQSVIIILLFIGSAYIGNREIVRLFFELALPALLLQKLFKAVYFCSRMSEVQDRFKSLFNDLMRSGFKNKTAEALRDILEYETALAWASIPLNSNVFFKYQEHLAEEWKELKTYYQIQDK